MPQRGVVLFGKPGCHLCEDAYRLLAQLGEILALELDIRQVDITKDPELEEEYGETIPVITLDNGVTLTAPIRPGPLRDALLAPLR